MIGYLEIAVVVVSFLVLLWTGAQLGRQALALRAVVASVKGDTQPKVDYLRSEGLAAQRRAFSIVAKQGVLQERIFVLRSSASRLLVLIKAFSEARARIAPILQYIGLG